MLDGPGVVAAAAAVPDAGGSGARYAVVREALLQMVDEIEPLGSSHWAEEVAIVLDQVSLDAQQQQRLLQSVTWRARTRGFPDPLDGLALNDLDAVSVWRLYTAAFFRRFEFKFKALHELTRYATVRFPHEVMFRVFHLFSMLGISDPDAGPELASLYSLVRNDPAALDTLVHGVWLSSDVLPDQDDWILRLSGQSIRLGDQSANVYFWRSAAFRRRGDYEKALESVNEALERHTLRDNHVHQDYVRERELVRAMQSISSLVDTSVSVARQELIALHTAQQRDASEEFARRASAIDDTISKSLSGVVEILGIFLALVGFLAGTGYLAINADQFWRSLVAFAVLSAGSLVFIVALRVIVRPRRG